MVVVVVVVIITVLAVGKADHGHQTDHTGNKAEHMPMDDNQAFTGIDMLLVA
jgi:hypothetical protein